MILKFNLFEQINELDPYGEENWNDDNIFNIGDIVVCVNADGLDQYNYNHVKLNKKYIVVDDKRWIAHILGGGGEMSVIDVKDLETDRIHYSWGTHRFKKI